MSGYEPSVAEVWAAIGKLEGHNITPEEMHAALAAAAAVQKPPWQRIDTAPRKTQVIICNQDSRVEISNVYGDPAAQYLVSFGWLYWMPIPDLPTDLNEMAS